VIFEDRGMSDGTEQGKRTGMLKRFAAACVGVILIGSAHVLAEPRAPMPASLAYNGNLSLETQEVVEWVLRSGDNQRLPYLIVDKKLAQVHVFDPQGTLLGSASALLGAARGDDSAPGIGLKKLSEIRVDERTTPAGRFVAEMGRNLKGEDILWVDYDQALSLHRVITSNRAERRAQRLASPSHEDNRISYGCINVPVAFYERWMNSTFGKAGGIVYILPEMQSLHSTFGFQPGGATSLYATNSDQRHSGLEK